MFDKIIEINKMLGGELLNLSNPDFLITKVQSKYKDKDFRKQIAKICSIIWMSIRMSIIYNHPFIERPNKVKK